MRSRNSARQTIREGTYDVCVIGGGATGTGCALDAQLRGLSTVLLDAGDFVSRTSTASVTGRLSMPVTGTSLWAVGVATPMLTDSRTAESSTGVTGETIPRWSRRRPRGPALSRNVGM